MSRWWWQAWACTASPRPRSRSFPAMLLAAVATLVGATLQSATGFGLALVLGPALFAVLDPAEALTTLLILGAFLNLLMLFTERRSRHVRWAELTPLLAAAAPGLVVGALVVDSVSKPALQVAVGVAVILAALFQARQRYAPAAAGAASGRGWGAGAAGLSAGTLTTTTSTNGPPLVLWFQRLGTSPEELRDSIAAALLPLNLLGTLALALLAGQEQAFDPGAVGLLVAFTIAGQVAGRRLFERLDVERFRTIGLVLIVLAGIASIAGGVAGA